MPRASRACGAARHSSGGGFLTDGDDVMCPDLLPGRPTRAMRRRELGLHSAARAEEEIETHRMQEGDRAGLKFTEMKVPLWVKGWARVM